jgi:hypothetical protein
LQYLRANDNTATKRRKRKRDQMTLTDRIQQLIRARHEGNVLAAARFIGIPQRTLAAIYSGQVKSPRAAVLERISAAYPGVTLDWLVRGIGEGPNLEAVAVDPTEPWGDLLEWTRLVDSLDLPLLTGEALEFLPYAVRNVSVYPLPPDKWDAEFAEAMREMFRLALRTWHRWLSTLIMRNGREWTRAKLIDATPLLALGLTRTAETLLKHGVVSRSLVEASLQPRRARREALESQSRAAIVQLHADDLRSYFRARKNSRARSHRKSEPSE